MLSLSLWVALGRSKHQTLQKRFGQEQASKTSWCAVRLQAGCVSRARWMLSHAVPGVASPLPSPGFWWLRAGMKHWRFAVEIVFTMSNLEVCFSYGPCSCQEWGHHVSKPVLFNWSLSICQVKCFPFSYISYQSTFSLYCFFSYYSFSISATVQAGYLHIVTALHFFFCSDC